MDKEIVDVEEIRTNTYQVTFVKNKVIVVYAPNVDTAIKRALDRYR